MAIKEFFVKLTSWNSNRNRTWERSAAERFQQENQTEKALSDERLKHMRETRRQTPEIDLTPQINETPENPGQER